MGVGAGAKMLFAGGFLSLSAPGRSCLGPVCPLTSGFHCWIKAVSPRILGAHVPIQGGKKELQIGGWLGCWPCFFLPYPLFFLPSPLPPPPTVCFSAPLSGFPLSPDPNFFHRRAPSLFAPLCPAPPLRPGNNNKINWAMNDKQEFIDIVETVYRGARKGRGLVVSPKDYSTKYRY